MSWDGDGEAAGGFGLEYVGWDEEAVAERSLEGESQGQVGGEGRHREEADDEVV